MNTDDLYSFSKLNAFHQCKYQYYLNYILKEKGDQNVYGYLGGVIHDLCEKLTKKEITLDYAKSKWLEEVEFTEVMDMNFPTEKSKNSYVTCIYGYLEQFTPLELEGKEIFTEEYFVIDIDGITLRGFIDFYSLDHENKNITLIDYKSSSKFSKKDLESEKVFQLILYGMYLENKYPGYRINHIGFDMMKYAEHKETGKVKPRENIDPLEIYDYDRWLLYIDYNEEMKNKLKKFILETVNEISYMDKNNEKDWIKNSKNKFYCNNLCSFFNKCNYNK